MTDNPSDLASAIELLPCPFCGGEAVISDNNTGLVFYVRCKQCRSAGPAERCATDAAATWNTRSALSYSEEPSPEMIEAGVKEARKNMSLLPPSAIETIYRAMRKAAITA